MDTLLQFCYDSLLIDSIKNHITTQTDILYKIENNTSSNLSNYFNILGCLIMIGTIGTTAYLMIRHSKLNKEKHETLNKTVINTYTKKRELEVKDNLNKKKYDLKKIIESLKPILLTDWAINSTRGNSRGDFLKQKEELRSLIIECKQFINDNFENNADGDLNNLFEYVDQLSRFTPINIVNSLLDILNQLNNHNTSIENAFNNLIVKGIEL
ncbi:MAG: hypothetical protein FWE63_02405 [Bacteroidales bacterium]|nr:hypothetical protein [Bacteroidales bacterium]